MNMNVFAGSLLKVAALAGLLLAGTAQAMPVSWVTLNTIANPLDTVPSDALAENYSALFCTVNMAQTLFGGSSVSAIEAYFTDNYSKTVDGMSALTDPYYVDGSYTLDAYDGTEYQSADYVAVVFYGDDGFRVYGEGSAQLVNGNSLVFNDVTANLGTVGSWLSAGSGIPEPSSGLLLLMGGALLALRRRRK